MKASSVQAPAADVFSFSTRAIPAARKVESWNEQASSVITDLHVEPSRDIAFDASLRAAEFGGIGFIDARSTPTRVVHTHPAAELRGTPAYLVHLQLTGTSMNRQLDREVVLEPGDFVLCDSTLPCELRLAGDNRMLVLRIPQSLLRRRLIDPDFQINRHMSGKRGSALLVSRFMAHFWDECQHGLAPWTSERLAGHLCDLLATAFADAGALPLDRSVNQAHWKLRIRQFVDAHLHDSSLTPGTIANHFGISARYVHKLHVHGEESISKYILQRRLDACHRALRDPHQRARSISSIAFEWGFNSGTHFARVFRARYDQSPAELRQLRPALNSQKR